MNTRRTRKSKHKGIATLWVTVFALLLIVFLALVIDIARICVVGHQLQNAADSAALAGARLVASDPNNITKITARLKAQEYAGYNEAAQLSVNLAETLNNGGASIQGLTLTGINHPGDIIIGRYAQQSRTFTPTLNTPNAMKVVARKNGLINPELPMIFGKMFNVADVGIQKYAIALIYNASGAAVIALSDTDTGLYLHGTPTINVDNDGSIYANSVDIDAVDLRGTPGTEAAEINIVGDVAVSGSYDVNQDLTYDGLPASLNTGVDPIVDPYKDLLEPALAVISTTAPADGSALKITGGTVTLQPGYYPGGIEITGGDITLSPGIYQVGQPGDTKNEGGLSITGGITNADQVMFHIIGGDLDIRGNTQLTLTPPTSETTGVPAIYDGISVFQSRDNHLDAEINGGGGLDMTGVLYFPENKLWIAGDGDTIGTQLIADTIDIGGTGEINIPFNGTPEESLISILVE